MATVQITGVLKHPMDGAVGKATIRVIAQDSVDSILSLTGEVITGTDGTYDFDLVYGTHTVEINFKDEYHMVGIVTIDELTPASQDLQSLLST